MPRNIKISSAEKIADKWAEVTPGRAEYYASETPEAGAEWEKNTKAAGGTYKAAVSAAGIQKRFEGGVDKAGAAKFARKVKSVGVDRYGPGIAAAKQDMKDGFAPFRDELDGLEIPDRGPRGSTQNYRIGDKIGNALHKKRLALIGAGS